jgi:hypothetical protein
VLIAGAISIDTAARRTTRDGPELALTVREFDLVAFLMGHRVVGNPPTNDWTRSHKSLSSQRDTARLDDPNPPEGGAGDGRLLHGLDLRQYLLLEPLHVVHRLGDRNICEGRPHEQFR